MAKKKTSKTSRKKVSYKVELWGVFFILVGILGFGEFGPVGTLIKGFAIFLMGTWYVFFLGMISILGLYMLINRKKPKYFTSRLIGTYLLLISILTYSHLEYAIKENLSGTGIIEATIDNFMNTNVSLTVNSGGGIIGGLFTIAFTNLFEYTGTKIVLLVFLIIGLILVFNIRLGDIFNFLKSLAGKARIEDDDEEEDDEEEEKTSKKKRKQEKSLEDTICTPTLENVKVYNNMGEVLGQGKQEQLSMNLNNNLTAPDED